MSPTFSDSDADLLKRAALVLEPLRGVDRRAPREMRWRTTEQLAYELGLYSPAELDRLDTVLHRHETKCRSRQHKGRDDALVERAKYPDRTTVLDLWGPVRRDMASRARDSAERRDAAEKLPDHLRVPEAAPHVFLSYTQEDSALSFRVAKSMARLGIGAWRFETHIERGKSIAKCVKRAIEKSAGIVGLVTRTSVASLWILTELDTAKKLQKPLALIVDASDAKLVKLLLNLVFTAPNEDFDFSVKCTLPLLEDQLFHHYKDRNRTQSPKRVARYREQLKYFLASLPAYLGSRAGDSERVWRPALAFPAVPPRKARGFVQLAPMSDLRARFIAPDVRRPKSPVGRPRKRRNG